MTIAPSPTWDTSVNRHVHPADQEPQGLQAHKPQTQLNWLQAHARARAKQANAVLKTTLKALRRVSLDPNMIGHITAAALVLLHIEHGRTT